MCQDCKYFNINADRQTASCKRIDHKIIKFKYPAFTSYHCGQFHLICSDFIPKHPKWNYIKEWTTFKECWEIYNKVWAHITDYSTVSFIINDNKDIWYSMPANRFIYGQMWAGDKLRVNQKHYHKAKKIDGYILYPIVTENIDGLIIKNNTTIKKK